MRWRGALLTVGMVTALALWMSGQPQARDALERAAQLGPPGWLAALAGLLASHALRARRLQCEWQATVSASFIPSLRIVLTHAAAVNLLPMRAGELGLPWMLRRQWGIPLSDGALSLAWMRLQDMSVVAWLVASTAAVVMGQQQRLSGVESALAVGTASITLAAMAWHLPRRARRSPPVADGLQGHAGGGLLLRRCLHSLGDALHRATARVGRATWGWNAAAWLVKASTLAALLHWLSGSTLLGAWSGMLGGDCATALPLQPAAGFGTYEAGVALAVSWVDGVAWRQTLSAALLVHLFMVLVAVAGALALTLCPWARPEAARPGPGSLPPEGA